MTTQIALSLGILGVAVILFISERLRVDLVALLVLVALTLTGLITSEEAFSGFSNPAVITVWAVFILSGGLTHTGIAKAVGRKVLQVAGNGEVGLIIVIMLTAAVMSAFMNNVGVVAMLLPVVVDISRRTHHPPSRLLMPLAFGSLLGGLTTLISTPPNILASIALQENNLAPFQFFDFAPVGLSILAAGILYMVLIGRRLLPSRDFAKELLNPGDLFGLQDRLFFLLVPPDSSLAGKTLAECRLGSALSLNVIGIFRDGDAHLAPSPTDIIQGGDRLLVSGRTGRLRELEAGKLISIETDSNQSANLSVEQLTSKAVGLAEITLRPHAAIQGKTLAEINFRPRFGVVVLAILRNGSPFRTGLQDLPLNANDRLLVQATPEQLDTLHESENFFVSETHETEIYRLSERLHILHIPAESSLDGKTLAESRLGAGFGLGVMSIVRKKKTILMPEPDERLRAGDQLIVKGKLEDLSILEGLQTLTFDEETETNDLESEEVGLVEIVLSPHSSIDGKSLRQINFREKFGMTVLAVMRGGRAYRHKLRNMPLRFGDALLLHGPRQKVRLLADEPDFILLTEGAQQVTRNKKAPLAILIMAGVVISVAVGLLPISIAAVTGASLMILSGILSMDEAYRSIQWQAVFLIAGMLPLGIALQNSGAASFLAKTMVDLIGPLGNIALIAGIFILTMLASQVMPNPVMVVLVAPIALNAAVSLNLSPHALMMVVAMAASSTFLSPVGHPTNILIMAPGSYRFKDYFKVGFPLTIIIFVIVLLVLPIFWPLSLS